MSRDAIATINLSALRHNLSCAKQFASGRSILAMIKSNGYGHGLLRVARALSGADAFGVACLEEALILRKNGIDKPIVVMAGFYDNSEVPLFFEQRITPVIHRFDQIAALENAQFTEPLFVWLKIDSGMNRLGFSLSEVPLAYKRLQACRTVQTPIGLMTHLADADNKDRIFTEQQITAFKKATQDIEGPKSIVNSAGLMQYENALADWVRPGVMLYGASPFLNRSGVDMGLQPVMTLSAKLIAIKNCRAGDVIGYGCLWRCEEAMQVGIVGIGYGDGYPRHAISGTPTLIHGKLCPLVGRVSMDMIAVDLRAVPTATVGDKVILWGKDLPIEKIASNASTISYELLCGVTQQRIVFAETNDAL